ncbi:DNA translocase FtsK [Lysinibacillus sp. SGAir0095]|uniref:DNA translocase FtsK n=1 Tax=Lysinibacillus sp. SGAir0095 TaxID=2070463 RepID=UPI0010CD63CC|nr:DNA translocase FtsK [Lysinibacillus sp. SGAir0095]QCR33289.1 DNA translocase FtsK [Lysinibacillus sp. SGAir0095]
MNWFKKQINKLFDNDIDDDQYYEEDVFEDELVTTFNNSDERKLDDPQNNRKSFKFPIISDEEMELPNEPTHSFNPEAQNHLSNRFEESRRDIKYFYQPNAISKVYDVEVSGIRDLLEKRQRIKGHSNVINRQESTILRRVEKVKAQEQIKKDYRNTATIKKNLVEQEDPLVPKRRFVPTQVPSPVHGFKKPSKIDELLSKKQEKIESNSNEKEIENVLTEDKNIPSINYSEHENRVEAVLSESLIVKEENLRTAQPKVKYREPLHEVPVTSFIDIEDEVEEKPIYLKEELYEKVEELPNLAEETDERDLREDQVVEKLQRFQANQQLQVYQEAAVTVYEAEPFEGKKIDMESHGMVQDEGQKSSELDFMELQNDQELEEYFETKQFHEESEPVSESFEEQVEFPVINQENEVINSNLSYEEPSDIYPKTEFEQEPILHPIQSAQVQKLVSIALNDSQFTEETDEQIGHEQESFTSYQPEAYENNLQETVTTESEEEKDHLTCENEEQKLEQPQSKGSKLPFNVLMLKSDKEKYAAKLAQKQMLQHNDDNKEMYRQITKTEESHEKQPLHVNPEDLSPLTVLEPYGGKQESEIGVFQEEKEQEIETPLAQTSETISLREETEETPEEIAIDSKVVSSPPKIYVKPSLDFLTPPEEKTEDREWLESQADILVESLSYFQVTAQVEAITQGPAVTQFEITVGHGTKVSKIRNLSDDLKLALAAKDIRIQAPIPGKSTIGIEIPNRISRAVQLSEVTCSDSFKESESPLEAALGLDLTGKPVTIDLRKMPHGLIAGATGSGKSVCINSILISLLYKANPNELKLMLIDPKMVELAPFNNIPHLVSPVISDVKAATAALKWAVEEMERRYQLFAHVGVRDLPRFNKLAESKGEYGHKLPYILIVIDELADLMMMSPQDVEEAICRIAQKARACGIHLIVATQRPSVDVITGLIKSNIPTRIAFAVSSQIDSRTIIDSQGAERLLGRGDMLYLGNGMSDPIRLQGTFVTDDEIEEIIDHVRGQGEPDYFFQQDELLKKTELVEEQDELFEEVCRFVHEQGSASTSSIQRKYHIGYNRAARLIDMLESQGFVSEPRGSKPREVYITESDLTSMFE